MRPKGSAAELEARRRRAVSLLRKGLGIREVARQGAPASGSAGQLWTLPRVAEVIQRHFGIHYHPAHVWKILRSCGWSAQKPQRRARERDEAQIERWRRERWPHIKKGAPAGPQHRFPG